MDIPFESVVAQHGPTVLRVCRALLRHSSDAEDAWAETFLSALRTWPDMDPGTNVEAWLVRVARNKSIDIMRRRSRTIPVADPALDRPAAQGEPNTDQLFLWEAVSELPERQRQAVAYHYLGGLSHVETAELLGIKAPAVRRAAADGIRSLRQSLARSQSPEGGQPHA